MRQADANLVKITVPLVRRADASLISKEAESKNSALRYDLYSA